MHFFLQKIWAHQNLELLKYIFSYHNSLKKEISISGIFKIQVSFIWNVIYPMKFKFKTILMFCVKKKSVNY